MRTKHKFKNEPEVVTLTEVPSVEELVEALKGHRAEIVEANEWRPLADHVRGIIRACIKGAGRSHGQVQER